MTDLELEQEYARREFFREGLRPRIHKHWAELGLGPLADELLAILDNPLIDSGRLKQMLAGLTILRMLDADREDDLAKLKQTAARQRKQMYYDHCRFLMYGSLAKFCAENGFVGEVIQ